MRVLDSIFVLAGGAALFGGYTVFSNPPSAGQEATAQAPRLPLVETAPAEVVESVAGIRQTALLRAASEVVVTTEAAGRVAWVNPSFQLGERLPRGAEVFRLDAARLETDVARARADVDAAKAERARLLQELDRISTLVDRNVSSQTSLVTTQTNLAAAEAKVAQTEAAFLATELAVNEATIVAPFDAVVAAETLSEGQFLQPGTEVGRLVSADSAELLVRLNAEQLQKLEEGGDLIGRDVIVTATDGSGASKPGIIRRVALTSETATQTTAVLVSVDQPFSEDGGVFRLNSLFEAEFSIPNAPGRLLSVPVEAVQAENRIWVVEDGALRQVAATIDRRVNDRVLVQSEELLPGDSVLVTRLPAAIEGLKVGVVEQSDARQTTADISQ